MEGKQASVKQKSIELVKGKSKKILKKVTTKKTSVTIKKLKRSKTYYFKVRGLKNGKFSSMKKIKL